MVAREHNRLATDDKNTKQWYGIYTASEFFALHQKMCELESNLDCLLPAEVRPIKGYMYTYFLSDFRNSITKPSSDQKETTDLQDNQLCRSLTYYLNQAFEALGKNLFIDIMFNDIHADNYFEVYSEFSLSRIQANIERYKHKNILMK